MSVARGTDLLSGENWVTLYQAFRQVDFRATDPTSIASALRDYIRTNYPESFNDWIVSSEFVAIIDLLSWLAGTLAFRTDIAARENFIDTAESRESILRLARFLSYNPSRCQPSIGVVKIVQVSTNDDVFDSFGVNLANTNILWNDSINANWFEQFTLVLNNAFVGTNPFGVPLAQGMAPGSLSTQLYRVNGLASDSSLNFSANVSGIGMDFEICNADFTDGAPLAERVPNPINAMQLYYLNDSNGNASARTGFFLLFKQGTTSSQTFNLPAPIQNQIIDINATNVNQTDVWVATVDDNGTVLINWTQVPILLSNNITYNNVPSANRNLFSVITRDNDQISVRFSDGNFADAPVGNIQVKYRVSNALQYSIRPSEIDNISLPIAYTNPSGVKKTLTVTFSLFEDVSNAAPSETIEQIRQRAPQVYATQNRMVSGEDYNTFPLNSNIAVKIKAVNRIYSGQSRYIDLHDPTGTYQDLSLFADDGIFFRDRSDTYFEVPTALNRTPDQLFNDYIKPAIDQYTTANLIRDVLMQVLLSPNAATVYAAGRPPLRWNAASATTGWFFNPANQDTTLIQPGCLIQFLIKNVPTWVAVVSITASLTATPPANAAGPVTLSQPVPQGATVLLVLPQALTILSPVVIDAVKLKLKNGASFSLLYDFRKNGGLWVVADPQNDLGPVEAALDASYRLLVMNVNCINGLWRINSRGLRYVFESLRSVQWYDNGQRTLATQNGTAVADTVRVLKVNQDLHANGRGFALGQNLDLTIDRLWTYADGTAEPRRTTVNFADSNADGYPDHPDLYYTVVADDDPSTYLFWDNRVNPPFEQPLYDVRAYGSALLRTQESPQPPVGTIAFQVPANPPSVFDGTFWVMQNIGWVQDTTSFSYRRGRGPNTAAAWVTQNATLMPFADNLSFQWKHYALSNHRINPASTNIIDIFVLTFAYDAAVRQWVRNGAIAIKKPVPPSELELGLQFAALETSKMFSDTIVWRPVRYKFLFGTSADPSLQAQFKVVRLANSAISDGEIQSKMITAIDTYFDISRWDFGETFFYSELAAYIHQQLVGLISSVVIVPRAAGAVFGDGFEISCAADEVFISTAQVSDIVLISSNTAVNLRMGS